MTRVYNKRISGDFTRVCSKCTLVKNIEEFGKDKAEPSGLKSNCKSCDHLYYKQKPKRNKRDVLAIVLRNQYNWSIDEYEKLAASIDNKCTICQEVCQQRSRLCVDHCHKTLKIRGLLCVRCNQGLGAFRDNIDLMKKAINYLEK